MTIRFSRLFITTVLLYFLNISLSFSQAIGDFYEGGILFHTDSITNLGYVVSDSDIGYVCWGCFNYTNNNYSGVNVSGGTQTIMHSGAQNTINISADCNSCGSSSNAAQLCSNLSLNGYDDWFLPSKDELLSIYQNLVHPSIYNNFSTGGSNSYHWYWSSSENLGSLNRSWSLDLSCTNCSYYMNGQDNFKHELRNVRAIREVQLDC